MTTKTKYLPKGGRAIIDNSIKSRDNDPYYIKKDERAREILREVGVPGYKNLQFI